jgi:hypothetical protein
MKTVILIDHLSERGEFQNFFLKNFKLIAKTQSFILKIIKVLLYYSPPRGGKVRGETGYGLVHIF